MVAIPMEGGALTGSAKTVAPAGTKAQRSPRTVWVGLAAVVAIVLLGFGFWSGRLVGFRSSKSAPVVSQAAPVSTVPPPAANSPAMEKPSPSSPAPAANSSTVASHPAATTSAVQPRASAPPVAAPAQAVPDTASSDAAAPLPPSSSRTATLTLHDSDRNREIPLKIYYPDHISSSLPLIVFSHGYGGSREGYEYLGRGWADAGYIVIFPTHIGSDGDARGG
jgi:hypothetical protein